jgi:hypothetical protein
MSWLKHLFGPRKRLAGAMVLATTVALAGSLFAAPASASAEENRRTITVKGDNVRIVRVEGRPNTAFVLRTSGDNRVLKNVDFRVGNRSLALLSGRHHITGIRVGNLGYRYVLPATTWGMINPYLGMPFGYPWGYGLGPMVITTGFHQPALLRGFHGVIGLGDRNWLRLHGDD